MRERAPGALALWILALVLAPPSAAAAAPASERFVERRVGEVVVSAEYAWPESLDKGWFPVLVRLENRGEGASEVQLRLSDSAWNTNRTVNRALRLDAGERVDVELVASALHDRPSSYHLRITVDGERTHLGSFGAGLHVHAQGEGSAVLVFAESDPSPGTDERRTAEVSSRVLDGSQSHILVSVHGGATSESTPTNDNIRVRGARFDQLARSATAYTSLDAVVLDSARGVPAGARTEPLVAWLRHGGTLCVFGPGAAAAARTIPGLDPWMEERFALGSWNEAGGAEVRAWRAGLGLLFVGESEIALEDASQVAALRWVAETGRGVVPDAQPAGWRLADWSPVLEGLVELPYRAFAGLLLLFALVIGPLNFYAVKRAGRPVLLLLTIPAVALLASLGFLGYGILYQGLDVKALVGELRARCSTSARSSRSSTVEKRSAGTPG